MASKPERLAWNRSRFPPPIKRIRGRCYNANIMYMVTHYVVLLHKLDKLNSRFTNHEFVYSYKYTRNFQRHNSNTIATENSLTLSLSASPFSEKMDISPFSALLNNAGNLCLDIGASMPVLLKGHPQRGVVWKTGVFFFYLL